MERKEDLENKKINMLYLLQRYFDDFKDCKDERRLYNFLISFFSDVLESDKLKIYLFKEDKTEIIFSDGNIKEIRGIDSDVEECHNKLNTILKDGNKESVLYLPVDGLGVLEARTNRLEVFDTGEIKLLEIFTALMGDYVEIIKELKELEKQKELHKSINENAYDMISLLDSKGYIIYSNKAFKSLICHGEKQVNGKNACKFVHPEDRERMREIFYDFIEKGIQKDKNQYRLKKDDKNFVWVESRGSLIELNGCKRVLIITRDISGRKKVERELKESEKTYQSLY
ncbi:MAG: PAS domain S-box protein [Thermoplasmatota archaeon]